MAKTFPSEMDKETVINSKGDSVFIQGYYTAVNSKGMQLELRVWMHRLAKLDFDLETLKNDRTCTSIEAALIMTIGFAGVLWSPSRYTGTMNYLVPIAYALSVFCALLSVYTGSVEYLYLNVHHPKEFVKCVTTIGSKVIVPMHYMLFSMAALIVAAVASVFANVDFNCGVVVAVLGGVTLLLAAWHGLILTEDLKWGEK